MKNRIFFVFSVAMMAVCFLILALAMDGKAQSSKFLDTYNKVLELNKGRFADLNNLPIGAQVLFPSRFGDASLEVWKTVSSDNMGGKHDCIWRMTERYMDAVAGYNHVEADLSTVQQAKQQLPNPPPAEKQQPVWWWSLIAPALVIAFLLWFWFWSNRKKNPNYYPAVGENLERMSKAEAMVSLKNFLSEGDVLLSIHQGKLKRHFGPRKLACRMMFGDGFYRNVWMKQDDGITVMMIKNGENIRTVHRRSAGSNGFFNGTLAIPNGWYIDYFEFVQVIFEKITAESDASQLTEQPKKEKANAVYLDLNTIMEAAESFRKIEIKITDGKVKVLISKFVGDKKQKTKNQKNAKK